MLSKRNYAQLAAVAALTILFGANISLKPANAQAGLQLAQADVKKNTTTTKRVVTNGDRKRVTTRTTTRTAVNNNNRGNTRVVVRSGNYNRGVVTRSYAANSVAFVVHGPRAAYASYGSGWCRALHSGRHWAPRVGNHRGRHVGAVRCG